MTRLRVSLLAAVLSIAVAGGAARGQGQAQGQAPGPTFKSGTQLVPVYVTVTDTERHLVAVLVHHLHFDGVRRLAAGRADVDRSPGRASVPGALPA